MDFFSWNINYRKQFLPHLGLFIWNANPVCPETIFLKCQLCQPRNNLHDMSNLSEMISFARGECHPCLPREKYINLECLLEALDIICNVMKLTNQIEFEYSKTSKIDKTKVLMSNGNLMKAKSIAKCSPWSILQYFWPALSNDRSWKPILVFFLSGRLRQVLLYNPNLFSPLDITF